MYQLVQQGTMVEISQHEKDETKLYLSLPDSSDYLQLLDFTGMKKLNFHLHRDFLGKVKVGDKVMAKLFWLGGFSVIVEPYRIFEGEAEEEK